MNDTAPTPPAARTIGDIENYHAHVYYDGPEQRARMLVLRERIAERFPVQLVEPIDTAMGMHPSSMLVVAFNPDQFGTLVPWLMLNRLGLSILVHPNTDNPLHDHLSQAAWIGPELKFKPVDQLPEASRQVTSLKAVGRSQPPVVINTSPASGATI